MIFEARKILVSSALMTTAFAVAACGYVRVFDGSQDEKISWSKSGGYQTDIEVVESLKLCTEALDQSSIIMGSDDSLSSVTENINLPQTSATCSVSWSADAESLSWISINEGLATITRPTGTTDETVTLTATLAQGRSTETKTFTLTVKRKAAGSNTGSSSNAATELAACKSNLSSSAFTFASGDSTTSVIRNFTLPVTQNTCSVSWSAGGTSGITSINNSTGVATVSRQAGATDQTITLTATLTHTASGTIDTKTFSVTVLRALSNAEVDTCAASVDISKINFTSPDVAAVVTQNFTLPSRINTGGNICLLSWSEVPDSSAAALSGESVTVSRPAYASGDSSVTLKATASAGTAYTALSAGVNFIVSRAPATDLEKANECLAGFTTSNLTFTNPDTASSVKSNFTLPSGATISGHSCVFSSWQSNNSAVAVAGTSATVTRAADTGSDASVTISGTVTVNGISASGAVTANLTVPKYTEAESVAACKTALTTTDFTGLANTPKTATTGTIAASTTTITFPLVKSGVAGVSCTVSWSSNNASYLSVSGGTGTATHDYDGSHTSVTLTASLGRGSATDTKAFTMSVRSKFVAPTLKSTVAFYNTGNFSKIKVAFAASTLADAGDTSTISYKVCVSKDSSDLATITSMDAMGSGCQTVNTAYPSVDSPLEITISAAFGETWKARVYSKVDGQPNTDAKKILYDISGDVTYE